MRSINGPPTVEGKKSVAYEYAIGEGGCAHLLLDERRTKTTGHHLPVRADGVENELPGSEGCRLGGSFSSMQPPPRKVS